MPSGGFKLRWLGHSGHVFTLHIIKELTASVALPMFCVKDHCSMKAHYETAFCLCHVGSLWLAMTVTCDLSAAGMESDSSMKRSKSWQCLLKAPCSSFQHSDENAGYFTDQKMDNISNIRIWYSSIFQWRFFNVTASFPPLPSFFFLPVSFSWQYLHYGHSMPKQ